MKTFFPSVTHRLIHLWCCQGHLEALKVKDYALFLKGFGRFPSSTDTKPGQTGSLPPRILVFSFKPLLLLKQKKKERKERKSVGGWCCHGRNTDVGGPLVDSSFTCRKLLTSKKLGGSKEEGGKEREVGKRGGERREIQLREKRKREEKGRQEREIGW